MGKYIAGLDSNRMGLVRGPDSCSGKLEAIQEDQSRIFRVGNFLDCPGHCVSFWYMTHDIHVQK